MFLTPLSFRVLRTFGNKRVTMLKVLVFLANFGIFRL